MSVQLITENKKEAKRYRPQEKLRIIKEWEQSGNVVEIAEKYQIHPHTLYRWKKAPEHGAETYLNGKKPRKDRQLKALEEENRKLKEALTLQTPELILLKKREELGLSHRSMRSRYPGTQPHRIIEEVSGLQRYGYPISEIGLCA